MIRFTHDLQFGFIVPLKELETQLDLLRDGDHAWACRLLEQPIADRFGRERQYVVIAYTNPEDGNLPNLLSYAFPVVGESLVCLHPSCANPVSQGLYFEGDALKHDILEDWGRFWEPLSRAYAARSKG